MVIARLNHLTSLQHILLPERCFPFQDKGNQKGFPLESYHKQEDPISWKQGISSPLYRASPKDLWINGNIGIISPSGYISNLLIAGISNLIQNPYISYRKIQANRVLQFIYK